MPRRRLARLLRVRSPALPGARIVVGLGNPGAPYATHRHNVGARVVERLAERLRLPLEDKAKLAWSGQGQTPYGPVVLAKPRTYMNESGRAVQALLTRHRADPSALILVYDEVDLPNGRVRIRPGGGDGGQKGMRSIAQAVGSLDFPRVRIGIGRPLVHGQPSWDPGAVSDHVLADPGPDQAAALAQAEAKAAEAVIAILRDGVETAMNRFNAAADG